MAKVAVLSPFARWQRRASVVGESVYAMSVENHLTRSIVLYPAPTRMMDVRQLGARSKCPCWRGVRALGLRFEGLLPALGPQSPSFVGPERDLLKGSDGLRARPASSDLQPSAALEGREVAVVDGECRETAKPASPEARADRSRALCLHHSVAVYRPCPKSRKVSWGGRR